MPRATCRRSTPDRHHHCSGVPRRRSVPPRSRSDQLFGGYSRKCLDTHTNTHTHKHQSPNFFFSDPPEEIFVHKNVLCQSISTFYSLRFWTRGRHCLIALPWAKIVDIAMFKFNKALSFTRKAPMKVARAHVHDAPHHLVSFTIDLHSWSLIGVPISTSLAQSISKSEDYQRARAFHVHNAPQHPKSCTIK